MTVQHGVGAISNLPGGMVVDMVGKKGYLMAISLFWVGFPYALMSLTHSYWMLLVCVTLVGIGNNLWHPAAITTLAYRYPDRKGLVIAFHGMGGNIADGLAPLVVGALLAWFSWRTVVVINVVPGLVMAALILVMLGAFTIGLVARRRHQRRAASPSGVRKYLKDFASLLHNRELMLVSIGSAFRTMTQTGLLTFLPVYLAYELGYSPFAVGVCLAVMQVAGLRREPDRRPPVRQAGPQAHRHVEHGAVGRDDRVHGARRQERRVRALHRAGRLLPLRHAPGAAGVGRGIHARRSWPAAAWAMQFGIQAVGAAIAPAIFGMIADAYDLYTAFYFLAGTIVFANVLILFMPNHDRRTAAAWPRDRTGQPPLAAGSSFSIVSRTAASLARTNSTPRSLFRP